MQERRMTHVYSVGQLKRAQGLLQDWRLDPRSKIIRFLHKPNFRIRMFALSWRRERFQKEPALVIYDIDRYQNFLMCQLCTTGERRLEIYCLKRSKIATVGSFIHCFPHSALTLHIHLVQRLKTNCFRYKEGLRCISNVWPCSTYIKNEQSDRM